jgi:Flp pilus assembly protein TadG
MVETALVLSVLMMVLIGTIEFGRAIWTYNTVAYATRQGLRYAMVRGTANPATDAQIKDIIAANAVGLSKDNLSVTSSWLPNRQRGATVEVQVQYPFQFAVSPVFGSAASFTMASTGSAIVSQ